MKNLIPFLFLSVFASSGFAETYQCTVNTNSGIDLSTYGWKDQLIVEAVSITVNAPKVRNPSSDLTTFPNGAVDILIQDYVPGAPGTTPNSDRFYTGMVLMKAQFIFDTTDLHDPQNYVTAFATKGSRVITVQSSVKDIFINVFCELK